MMTVVVVVVVVTKTTMTMVQISYSLGFSWVFAKVFSLNDCTFFPFAVLFVVAVEDVDFSGATFPGYLD